MSRGFMFLAVLAFLAPSPRSANAQITPQGEGVVSVKKIADMLGLKPSATNAPESLELGATVTFTLVEPAKLAKHTLTGVHLGARVTVTRIAPDRVRVEADEIEPVPFSKRVTLRINAGGSFTPVPQGGRANGPG